MACKMGSQSVDRNPFVCPVCEVVYSTAPTSNSAPTRTNSCGHLMCVGCMKRRSWVNKEREETTTDCMDVYCVVCGLIGRSKREPARAHSFMEIMCEIDVVKSSTFMANLQNHSAGAEMLALTCPGCSARYSSDSTSDSSPFALNCGHSICASCIEQTREKHRDGERGIDADHGKYAVKCPAQWCFRTTSFNHLRSSNDASIRDVIKWLDKKRNGYVQCLLSTVFSCENCGHTTSCDRGFMCTDCDPDCTKQFGGLQRQRVLCAYCILEAHKTHTFKKFLPMKLKSLEKFYRNDSVSKITASTSEANVVLNANKSLMRRVKQCFSSAFATIPLATKCSEGVAISVGLRDKSEEFGDIMETIIPNIRIQNKKLEDLIKTLTQSFPQLVVADGESKGDGETQMEKGDREGDDGSKGDGEAQMEEGESKGDGESVDKEKREEASTTSKRPRLAE